MVALKLLILYLTGSVIWIFMFNRIAIHNGSTLHNRIAVVILWPIAILIVIAGLFWFEITTYFKK